MSDYASEEILRILQNGRLALRRLIDLIELAKTAKTKEEAEQFIKELELADYQALKSLEPDQIVEKRNIKRMICERGDYSKLKDLYTSLGAI